MKIEDEEGGRIFFSSIRRSLEIEDEIQLTSVGVDIGSSTSHLVFSRLLLERLDNRYIVSEREVTFESAVLLTPYESDQTIDANALGRFITDQYAAAGLSPESIDTGALILTGVAVRRRNARAIGELFAAQAGKFVSVSAGDALEATLAAFGSGAAAWSIRLGAPVMNVDIGGGTTKIAVCRDGALVASTALDVGARVVSFDDRGRVTRIEEAGHQFARAAGESLRLGELAKPDLLDRMTELMADRIFDAVAGDPVSQDTRVLLRLDPLPSQQAPRGIVFSGGVSEYIYERARGDYGDLGARLARAVRRRFDAWTPEILAADQGIRATVVGASQYTIQVSGSTIYVSPLEILPLRNLPVITPQLVLSDVIDSAHVAAAITAALKRLDLVDTDQAIAVCYRWEGSATFGRLDGFLIGVRHALQPMLAKGLPLVLIGDGDVGGLLGIHAREAWRVPNAIVSIDGVTLKEFDFIDVGAMLELSGAVPVVIKSLVFPNSASLGRGGRA
ncbi:MAG TPA: ethanolamine ammonia-lyase reactivating factor EutA [Vicinamibacterales bacterium]